MLFAEKLDDNKIMYVRGNYNFIDSCECKIPETCGIECDDIFVYFDSDNNVITVYSKNASCTVTAESCIKLLCTDFYDDSCIVYKL